MAGFRELPHGSSERFADVDSGPVLFGYGSVASAFGIGAAKAAGHLDHAVPLTIQAIAAAWATPFGFLVPGIMGYVEADSWPLGEVGLLFSMTRPSATHQTKPFIGHIPYIVWVLTGLYTFIGFRFISTGLRKWPRK